MMTLAMTMTLPIVLPRTTRELVLRKLRYAMRVKIREIVLTERRPFCLADLRELGVGGKKHQISNGTLRNYISKFKKSGEVEDAFPSNPKFYTIPGKKFSKSMTLDHLGIPNAIIDQSTLKRMPIYKWLKNQPMAKQSLHNIRLRFESSGLWYTFSRIHPTFVNPDNKDIGLQVSLYFDYLDVKVTIHHTDIVSVAVSCSFRPIAVDIPDILPLCEALTRTEIKLATIVEDYCNKEGFHSRVTIPRSTEWIATMWHFGVDTITEFTGREFQVTFGDGISDLYRIYTKRMKDERNIVRSERQEHPHQKWADALAKKLFPNGHLVDR
jgi:hypothetical protein